MNNIPVFHIDGGELLYLAKNIYKFPLDGLSPFNGMPQGVMELSKESEALAKDEEFKNAVMILCEPDLKLSQRRGGSTVPYEASTLYIKKVKDKANLVYLQEDEGAVLATLFYDVASYAEYFAAQNASPVTEKPLNLMQSNLGIENLLFIFNLLDCYRRAYLNYMLQDSTETVEAVYEDEFLYVFEKSLNSNDTRWLLPSFLKLVPGMEKVNMKFSEEQLEYAEAMDFVIRSINKEENRPIYYLDSNAKYMGLEFALLWKFSAGFEISAWDEKTKSIECKGRYYFAPTEEANHLIKIISLEDKAKFIHTTLSLKEVEEEIKNLLEEHLANLSKKEKFEVFTSKEQRKQDISFCPNCGTKVEKDSSFCSSCGTKLTF